jgi:hypothetical protein
MPKAKKSLKPLYFILPSVVLVLLALLLPNLVSPPKVPELFLADLPQEEIKSPAVTFNGSSGYIDTKVNQNLTSFTAEAWVYLTGYGEANYGRIIEKRRTTASPEVFNFFVDGSKKALSFSRFFSGGQGRWNTPNGSIQLNQWYHVAVTYTSNPSQKPTLYIDGASQPVTQINKPSGSARTNRDNYFIGNRGDQQRTFKGMVDEVRLWSKTRSAEEIRNNRYQELSLPQANLLAYFKLNKEEATATKNYVNEARIGLANGVTWGERFIPAATVTALATELVTNGNFTQCTPATPPNSPNCQPWVVQQNVQVANCGGSFGNCLSMADGNTASGKITQALRNAGNGTLTFWARNPLTTDAYYLLEIYDPAHEGDLNYSCRYWDRDAGYAFKVSPGEPPNGVYTAAIGSATDPCPVNGILRIYRTDVDAQERRIYLDNVSFMGDMSSTPPSPSPSIQPNPSPSAQPSVTPSPGSGMCGLPGSLAPIVSACSNNTFGITWRWSPVAGAADYYFNGTGIYGSTPGGGITPGMMVRKQTNLTEYTMTGLKPGDYGATVNVVASNGSCTPQNARTTLPRVVKSCP